MKRNQTLDIFRAFAFLIVFLGHLFNFASSLPSNKLLLYLQDGFRSAGGSGVDLFFVLSGFLISGLLFNELKQRESIHISRFLIRRGFKIYPLYYLLIFAYLIISISNHLPFFKGDMYAEIFFYNNYFHINPFLSHLWSIAIEEHFYFTLPFLLLLLHSTKKLNEKSLFIIYVLLFLTAFSFRLSAQINYGNTPDAWWKIYPQTHHRFDELFTGVLLCYLLQYTNRLLNFLSKYKNLALPLALLIIALNYFFFLPRWIDNVVLLSLNAPAYTIILVYFLNNRFFEKPIFKPLSYVGRTSYALYLIHYPILVVIHSYNLSGLSYYVISISIIFISGFLITYLIETPILKLRDYIFPSYKIAQNVKEPIVI